MSQTTNSIPSTPQDSTTSALPTPKPNDAYNSYMREYQKGYRELRKEMRASGYSGPLTPRQWEKAGKPAPGKLVAGYVEPGSTPGEDPGE